MGFSILNEEILNSNNQQHVHGNETKLHFSFIGRRDTLRPTGDDITVSE